MRLISVKKTDKFLTLIPRFNSLRPLILLLITGAFMHQFLLTINLFTENDTIYGEEIFLTTSNKKYTIENSMIFDKTLIWDPSVNRMWLNPELTEFPPAMLLLTSYGWNQENQTIALENFSRYIRETELLQGVINHPWFHPTAWYDFQKHFIDGRNSTGRTETTFPLLQYLITNTTTRFYVFLDVETYEEFHYPTYNGFDQNEDPRGGRVTGSRGLVDMLWVGALPVWKSFVLQAVPHDRIKVVVFDGGYWGAPPGNRNTDETLFIGLHTWHLPLAMVSLTCRLRHANQTIDQGLIPPPIKRTNLTEQQIENIRTCDAELTRPFFITYTGNFRNDARGNFQNGIDNGKTILMRRYFGEEYQESILANLTYEEVLMNSVFYLTPRGDQKYSYKFSEVLAAGAIPVVLSDDWMYPFRPELVDWNECAVILPEKYAGHPTIAVLQYISLEQRCRMRQRCYEIYKQFIERPEGTVDGVIQGLELVANGHRKPMNGVKCKLNDDGQDAHGYYVRFNVTMDVDHCNIDKDEAY